MSTIEDNVVKLSLDPRDFKSGSATALKHVDDLKKALSFDKQVSAVGSLQASAKTLDFSRMVDSIGNINSKLSTMGVVAVNVINTITTGIINATKNLFHNAIVAPISMGLEEYETQMNAVQTILANTFKAGTTLPEVNAALDELNTYADLTIYNFTQMTSSIGKFTAAGVDLDTSVLAIKGISNLAATSGASAEDASRAMYQLSQGIAAGVLTLQDWNSVVNANMGGQVFQDALMQTAKVHGVAIDGMIEKAGSFRGSLEQKWLSSEIMLETLSKFTGDLTAAQLESMGYTEEQIVGIMEMAVVANDAATKIKTLTQLKDTMVEALQSGWSMSFRIIFGDFEQAKMLWGGLGDIMGGIIGASAESRNSMLQTWSDMGGRSTMIKAVHNTIQAIVHLLGIFGEAFRDVFPPTTGGKLLSITMMLYRFSESLKMGEGSSKALKMTLRGVFAIFDILFMLISAILSPILTLVGITTKAGGGFLYIAAGIGEMIYRVRNAIKATNFFGAVMNLVIAYLDQGVEVLKELAKQFWSLEVVQDIVKYLMSLEKSDFIRLFWEFNDVLILVGKEIDVFKAYVGVLYQQFLQLAWVSKLLDYSKLFTWDNVKLFIDYLRGYLPIISSYLTQARDTIVSFGLKAKEAFDAFKSSDQVVKLLEFLQSFDGSRFKELMFSIKDFFVGVKNNMSDAKDSFDWIEKISAKLKPIFDELKQRVSDGIKDMMGKFKDIGGEIDFNKLAQALTIGLLGAVLLSIKKLMTGTWLSDVLDKFIGADSSLIKSVTQTLDVVQDSMVAWQNNVKADSLMKIAKAVGILVLSIIGLSLVDNTKLLTSVTTMSILLAELVATSTFLSKLNPAAVGAGAAGILLISGALLIMSIAIGALGALDMETVAEGIATSTLVLTQLVIAVKALSIGPLSNDLLKVAVSFTVLSVGLTLMSVALRALGSIDPEKIKQGLEASAISLATLAGFSKVVDGKKLASASVGVGLMSVSLLALAGSIAVLGLLDPATFEAGMIAMAAGLGIIALAVRAIGTGNTIVAALGILLISASLVILSFALKQLAKFTQEQLLQGLLAMAAIFVILGVAGLALGVVAPGMMLFAGAIALLGVGFVGVGAGIILISSGLIALGGSAALVGEGVLVVGASIITMLPKIAIALANALVEFVTTLESRGPEFFEASKSLFLQLLESIFETTPVAVAGLLDMLQQLLDEIVAHAPAAYESGWELFLGFLASIEDNIEEAVTKGLSIAVNFIKGMENGIPDLIEATISFMITFYGALAKAIEDYWPTVRDKLVELGGNIVETIKNAIEDRIEEVKQAMRELGLAAIAALKEILGIQSPSRVAGDIADDTVDGLLVQFDKAMNRVGRAGTEIGNKIQNGIKSGIGMVSEFIDRDLNINPVITPVLDLSGITPGLRSLNGSLSGSSIAMQINQDKKTKRPSEFDKKPGDGTNGTTIVYNQYITSPKALSTGEIYRLTSMQVAKKVTK